MILKNWHLFATLASLASITGSLANDCQHQYAVSSGVCGVLSGVACIYTTGLGCAIGVPLGSALALQSVVCSKGQGSNDSLEFDADGILQKLKMTTNHLEFQSLKFHETQRLLDKMNDSLFSGFNTLPFNQTVYQGDELVNQDNQLGNQTMDILLVNVNIIKGLSSSHGKLSVQYKENQLETKQDRSLANQNLMLNIMSSLEETLDLSINESLELVQGDIQNVVKSFQTIQTLAFNKSQLASSCNVDFKDIHVLRSKLKYLKIHSNGKFVHDEEIEDFTSTALLGNIGEKGNTILDMIMGNHGLQKKSPYEVDPSLCTQKTKMVFNNYIQEAFFYFTLSRELKRIPVSNFRKLNRDKNLIQHESFFNLKCGCQNPLLQLQQRGEQMIEIASLMSWEQSTHPKDFYLGTHKLVENGSDINVISLKLLANVGLLDFNNEQLIEYIRQTPIEDVILLTKLVTFHGSNNSFLHQILQLFRNTYGCYSGTKNYLMKTTNEIFKHIIQSHEEGKLYTGFSLNNKREIFGFMTNKNNIQSCTQGYIGEWSNNKQTGRGFLMMENGNYYIGEVKDGLRHGFGKLFYNPGFENELSTFEGEWKNDWKTFGNFTLKNNSIIQGWFQFANKTDQIFHTIMQPYIHSNRISFKQQINSLSCKTLFFLNPTETFEGMVVDGSINGWGHLVDTEGSTYFGQFKNNKKHGHGQMTMLDGSTYDGAWKEEKKHGRGKMLFSNGAVFDGYWSADEMTHGKFVYENGDVYQGTLQDGKKHCIFAKCTFLFANGDTYEGHWENDQNYGIAKMTYTNGDVYEGEWMAYKKHGTGKMYFANGNHLEGNWIADAKPLHGKMSYINGDVYTGQFYGDKKSGNGKMIYGNQDVYEGSWSNDQKSGNGKMIYANQDVYEGSWSADKKSGQGKMIYGNQDVYEGPWSDDKRSRNGKLKYKNGNIFEGVLISNSQITEGKMTYVNGDVYKGLLSDDEKSGEGKMIYANGDVFVGYWSNDKKSGHGRMTYSNGTVYEGLWHQHQNGMNRLLVVGHSSTVEVIDMSPAGLTCQNFANFPDSRDGVVGTLNSNQQPMVCGGRKSNEYLTDCYTYSNNHWIKSHSMPEKRAWAAAVDFKITPDATMIVTGGYDRSTINTTEYLTKSGLQKHSLNLPVQTLCHCLLQYNATTLMMIGGTTPQGKTNKTYFFNNDTQAWTSGPELKNRRECPGCAKFLLDGSDNQYAIAAVGGYNNGHGEINSVEIFDMSTQTWKDGPALPYNNTGGVAITKNDGKLIYLGYSNYIYQLEYDGKVGSWTKMPQKMSVLRKWFKAFFVPNDITNCS